MDLIEASFLFKALADENRLQIVQMLTQGEMCACKLLEHFSIRQPTLSHHMKILCECHLVQARKAGKWSYYSLNCATLTAFREFVAGLRCTGTGEGGCECS